MFTQSGFIKLVFGDLTVQEIGVAIVHKKTGVVDRYAVLLKRGGEEKCCLRFHYIAVPSKDFSYVVSGLIWSTLVSTDVATHTQVALCTLFCGSNRTTKNEGGRRMKNEE